MPRIMRLFFEQTGAHILGHIDILNQVAGRGDAAVNRLAASSRIRRQLSAAILECRALLAETRQVCGACLEFYRCLGAEPEVGALLDVLNQLGSGC